MESTSFSSSLIPDRLKPYFQEYDLETLELQGDANLIIQRTLEFGTWEVVRWLFDVYGVSRIRLFLRQYGFRWLRPPTFNYWRKLLQIHQWRRTPFPTPKGEVWNT
jgi:hypothetical protein